MVILIVEDEYLIGLALVLVLAVAGHHTVGPATSADEALQLAQAERPNWRSSISTSMAIATESTSRGY